jgi:hypothetical protein
MGFQKFTSLCTAETTLELLDSHSEVAACLVVELRESDAVQAGRAAISAARRDVTERGIARPDPMRDSVGDAVALVASASAVESPLANSLKHVVEKTRAIVDFIDETAKVSIPVDRPF